MHHEIGMNGRMDEFQGLVLRAKLPMLEGWHEGRRRHAQWYFERLKAITPDELVLPLEMVPDGRHIYNQFTIRVKGGRRDALMAHLRALGIGCAVYYPICLHEQPCFEYLGYGRAAAGIRAGHPGSASLPGLPRDDRGHAGGSGPGAAGLLQVEKS